MSAHDATLTVDELTFGQLITLEPHGPDTFVGPAPKYPWGARLFGGQVVAQALRAAQLTVPEGFACHSLHSYFIRGGTHTEPVRFEVDRIRNGRSFATRRVVARQSGGAILSLSGSFHVGEPSPDVQVAEMPDVPGPDGLVDNGWGDMLVRREATNGHGRLRMWIRLETPDGLGDADLASCGFAFISDSVPTGAVRAAHPRRVTSRAEAHQTFTGASLDHSIYFLRPVDPTAWLLVDMRCHGFVSARGVTVGDVFTADSTHVAVIVQEALLRERRPRDEPREGPASADGLAGKTV